MASHLSVVDVGLGSLLLGGQLLGGGLVGALVYPWRDTGFVGRAELWQGPNGALGGSFEIGISHA